VFPWKLAENPKMVGDIQMMSEKRTSCCCTLSLLMMNCWGFDRGSLVVRGIFEMDLNMSLKPLLFNGLLDYKARCDSL